MLFFELFSLNLSRLFHCSVFNVLCLFDSLFILSKCFRCVKNFLTFLFFITLSSAERYTSYHAVRVLSTHFLSFYIYFFLIVFTQLYIVFTYLSTYHLLLRHFSLLCIITPMLQYILYQLYDRIVFIQILKHHRIIYICCHCLSYFRCSK